MIDINELRQLTQAATPGPWKVGQYLGSPRQFVIHMDVGDKGRGSDVAFTSAAFGNDETIANARLIAATNPAAISELLDRLEAAEKETASWKGLAKQFGNEADALRAQIAEMERQKPVGWQVRSRPTWNDGPWSEWRKCSEGSAQDIKNTPLLHDWHYEVRALYALPGAKGE